jgi:thiamine kinase-like enzyme
VARVCRELPLLGIDRRSEAAAQSVAARLGLAPELIHHEEGLLVSRHLAGRTLAAADLQDLGLIAHVGAALRRLHDARDAVTGQLVYFRRFQTIRTYARSAAEQGARLPDEIDELLEDARSLPRRIGPFLPALCHNDLLPANLIWSDGRLWLIDWEYAGMGHPLFDLASVSANAGLTDTQEQALLESYRGMIGPRELEEIRTFKLASSLRAALWAVIQSVISELSFDSRVRLPELRGLPPVTRPIASLVWQVEPDRGHSPFHVPPRVVNRSTVNANRRTKRACASCNSDVSRRGGTSA